MENNAQGFFRFDEIMLGVRMVKKDNKTVREKTGFHSMQARLRAAENIVQFVEKNHEAGLYFIGLDRNAFYINTETGEIRFDGKGFLTNSPQSRLENLSLLAPEIITERAALSEYTDRHTLAVLLFELLLRVHPLEGVQCNQGSRITIEREAELYGERPLFIFDPDSDANHLADSVQERVEKVWNSYPDFVRKTFMKAFTEGLFHPESRISEKEWAHIFEFMLKSRQKKSEEN